MNSGQLLSCGFLIISTGTRFFIVSKRLTNNYSTIRPEFIGAAIGVLAINARAICNYLYPYFYERRPPEQLLHIAIAEREAAEEREKKPVLEKICRTLSNGGFLYSLFECYKIQKIGLFVIYNLAIPELCHYMLPRYPRQTNDQYFHFSWMTAAVFLGCYKRNWYCVAAYWPYLQAFFMWPPEKHQAWSSKRIINNYLMVAYTWIILEAILTARFSCSGCP